MLPVSPRAGRPTRSAQGQEQDRHHQARHRPGLRRQGRAGGPAGDRPGATRRASRRSSAQRIKENNEVLKAFGAKPLSFKPSPRRLPRGGRLPQAIRHQHRHAPAPRLPTGPAHPLRGRPGHVPRHRPRHLSVRHFLEHHGRRRLHRLGRARRIGSTGWSA